MEQTNDSGQPASLMQTNANEVVVRGNDPSHVVRCYYTPEHQRCLRQCHSKHVETNSSGGKIPSSSDLRGKVPTEVPRRIANHQLHPPLNEAKPFVFACWNVLTLLDSDRSNRPERRTMSNKSIKNFSGLTTLKAMPKLCTYLFDVNVELYVNHKILYAFKLS